MTTDEVKAWSTDLQQRLIEASNAADENRALLGEAACLLLALTNDWSNIEIELDAMNTNYQGLMTEHRNGKQTLRAMTAAFVVNMMRAHPTRSRAEIEAEIARAVAAELTTKS